MTVLSLVSIWFAQNLNFNATKKQRSKLIKELLKLPNDIKDTLEGVTEACKQIALSLVASKHIFFLGSTNLSEVIAKEGELKMKELTYLHCQAIGIGDITNNYWTYFKQHVNSTVIVIVLQSDPNKEGFV